MTEQEWLIEQISERLSFYQSLTGLGFVRKVEKPMEAPAVVAAPRAKETLEEIRADLGDCTRCVLHEKRTHLVFGVGNPNADLMFIGEGPGSEEDRQGIPFVGPAGQLLTKIINAIDLSRDDVYIANVVKCRPPNNADPEPDQIAACASYLDRQIEIIDPKVIVTLGRFSMARWFSGATISKIHGQPKLVDGRLIVPMFHPAAALHRGDLRPVITADFQKLPALVEQVRSGDTDDNDISPAPEPERQSSAPVAARPAEEERTPLVSAVAIPDSEQGRLV